MFSCAVAASQTAVTFSLTVMANEWKSFRRSQKEVVPLRYWLNHINATVNSAEQ